MAVCFPHVVTAYTIFFTLPMTVASNECRFSKLKLLKTYLRAAMPHDRLSDLGLVAPSRFSSELDQVGRRELVHDDCALHHFWLNSISLELKFKPEPAILSDRALNSAFLHK